jgi:hypothetical protein
MGGHRSDRRRVRRERRAGEHRPERQRQPGAVRAAPGPRDDDSRERRTRPRRPRRDPAPPDRPARIDGADLRDRRRSLAARSRRRELRRDGPGRRRVVLDRRGSDEPARRAARDDAADRQRAQRRERGLGLRDLRPPGRSAHGRLVELPGAPGRRQSGQLHGRVPVRADAARGRGTRHAHRAPRSDERPVDERRARDRPRGQHHVRRWRGTARLDGNDRGSLHDPRVSPSDRGVRRESDDGLPERGQPQQRRDAAHRGRGRRQRARRRHRRGACLRTRPLDAGLRRPAFRRGDRRGSCRRCADG